MDNKKEPKTRRKTTKTSQKEDEKIGKITKENENKENENKEKNKTKSNKKGGKKVEKKSEEKSEKKDEKKDEKIYTYAEKFLLSSRIKEIKSQREIDEIRKLIFDINPEIKVNKTGNGVLIHFHNLKNETYISIDKYLKNLEDKKRNKTRESLTGTITENSDTNVSDNVTQNINQNNNSGGKSDDINFISTNDYNQNGINGASGTRAKLRLSNREKKMLNRKIYERYVSNEDEIEENNRKNNANNTEGNNANSVKSIFEKISKK